MQPGNEPASGGRISWAYSCTLTKLFQSHAKHTVEALFEALVIARVSLMEQAYGEWRQLKQDVSVNDVS